jgi:hypothetical protein
MAKLTDEQRQHVFVLYEELGSMQKVADALGITKGYVHQILHNKNLKKKSKQLVNAVKQAKQESNNELLELIQSTQVSNIVTLAMSKLTSEAMDKDIERGGIANMYRLIGMFTDKVLSAKDHDIKLKQLEIRQKELAIKEKELELRISNPEAFATVNIINDAPREEDYATTHI